MTVERLHELGWFKFVPAEELDASKEAMREAILRGTLVLDWKEESADDRRYQRFLKSRDGRTLATDSEELAEGDVHQVLMTWKAELAGEGVSFSSAQSDTDRDEQYDLIVDGERFPIFEHADAGGDWATALQRAMDIANALLSRAASPERVYGLGRGNDTYLIMMTRDIHSYIETLPLREGEIPYEFVDLPGFTARARSGS